MLLEMPPLSCPEGMEKSGVMWGVVWEEEGVGGWCGEEGQ
jgi:hypothetical protein